LARREAAIVSPYPGTTRDVIEVHLDLVGYPVTLLDTAGIRPSEDPVEREGIRRATTRAAAADLVLWVIDSQAIELAADFDQKNLGKTGCWLVCNKVDLAGDKLWTSSEYQSAPYTRQLAISAATGAGVDALVGGLADFARAYFAATESALVTRARHRRALEQTAAALSHALAHTPFGAEELIAEDLRSAATTLGRLTGRVDVEDILDVIFRDFCIGK
jgi:tRNA modification GTPase